MSARLCIVSVRWRTTFIRNPRMTTSTTRIAPSRQLTASVAGKSTTSATSAAKCSRKNESHTPNMPEAHDLEQPAGVGARVETHRQMKHVTEKSGHDHDAAPVREPVGMEGDGYAGDNGENAERRPGREPGPDSGPLERSAGPLRVRQLVDHLAEQERLGELGDGERDIGKRQRRGEPFFRPEQPQDPSVGRHERHWKTLSARPAQAPRASSLLDEATAKITRATPVKAGTSPTGPARWSVFSSAATMKPRSGSMLTHD